MDLLDDLEKNKENLFFTFKSFKVGEKEFNDLYDLLFKYICISDNKDYSRVQDKNESGSVLNAQHKEEKFKKVLQSLCSGNDFKNLHLKVNVAYENMIKDTNIVKKAKTIEKVAKEKKTKQETIIIHKDQKTINDFDNDNNIEEENPLAILNKTIKKD